MMKEEILIGEDLYDISKWKKFHPGGNVINYYTGSSENATVAVQQFHHRFKKKLDTTLKSLPKNRIEKQETQRSKELTEDFTELYDELRAQGIFDPSRAHVFLRLLELLVYFLLSIWFLSAEGHLNNWMTRMLGILFLTMYFSRVVWINHETGHYSLTGHVMTDRFLQSFLNGIGNGCSGRWWSKNHSKHHAMPQRLDRDIDLETLPLIAFSEKVLRKSFPMAHNFFIETQGILFLPLHCFIVSLKWNLYLHPRYAFIKKDYFELFCMLSHYVPIYYVGLSNFLCAKWLWSMYMFGNFALSHTHTPVTTDSLHWVEYSFLHTINIRSSSWIDWFMGYLNFQIEHHLFPSMPQFRSYLIQERVRKLANKHGLPYRTLSFLQALNLTFKNLFHVSYQSSLLATH